MGERKVLNKYIPPDFDPSKIPKANKLAKGQMKVRMMLPMSVCCNTCGNYIVKGTKFNSRKEDVIGEDYLGIMIFRFYFRCTRCSAELVMKTDPKNSDYVVEAGASRNFEPWREKDSAKEAEAAEREAEEEGNSMAALENRTLESKREMDIMAGGGQGRRHARRRHARPLTPSPIHLTPHSLFVFTVCFIQSFASTPSGPFTPTAVWSSGPFTPTAVWSSGPFTPEG